MFLTARLRVAASFVVITIAAACSGDSTAPSPASVAAHFDSLYVQAHDLGDSNSVYISRALLLSLFEMPPAFGASPSSISVTTASGVEHWNAFEFVGVGSNATDSGYVVLAYRENAAHTMFVVQYDSTGSAVGGLMLTNDTLAVSISDGNGTTSLTSTGAACGTPSASLANPQIPEFEASSCALAKFLTSLSLTTQTSASIDPALASISISSRSINGIRLQDPAEAAVLRRVRAVLHSARVGNRL